MNRRDILLEHITREQRGIEIGPYHSPIAPKREGYRCLSLDVFDAATLRQKAAADPLIPRSSVAAIEDVDLEGSSTEIAELVLAANPPGSFDYVISSHNLEHMPDPVRFLAGCGSVLRPGGLLVLAVPDRRACFDYFRPFSTLAELLAAHAEQRTRPTPAQTFAQASVFCRSVSGSVESYAWPVGTDPATIQPVETLEESYAAWRDQIARSDTEYRDTHCWTFTPASFELVVRDLRFLGLIDLEIDEVTGTFGHEFFVRMTNRGPLRPTPELRAAHYAERALLLRRTIAEASGDPDDLGSDRHPNPRSASALALEAMRNSWSWRLTAPARRTLDLLRRAKVFLLGSTRRVLPRDRDARPPG